MLIPFCSMLHKHYIHLEVCYLFIDMIIINYNENQIKKSMDRLENDNLKIN